MSDTETLLPGEGDTKTETYKRVRRECDECGEPATLRITFLHLNARSNPASQGYGKDDISWCSDAESYACDAHECEVQSVPPVGMRWASTRRVSARYAHLFLHWQAVRP